MVLDNFEQSEKVRFRMENLFQLEIERSIVEELILQEIIKKLRETGVERIVLSPYQQDENSRQVNFGLDFFTQKISPEQLKPYCNPHTYSHYLSLLEAIKVLQSP